MEKLGQNNIYSQYLGNKAILRTYKGTDLINEYVPLYTPPVDWSDIRTDCPENSIALYAAHSVDYSSYDNLGFTATCVGGYNVFIDGDQYGTTYASGSNCTITWSSLTLTTGDNITTPSALKAHKIWIEPAIESSSITAFKCARVSASGQEEQGLLWAHFNISNYISISKAFGLANNYDNSILTATTAKNNILNITICDAAFTRTASLQYVPLLCGDRNSRDISNLFSNSGSPSVSLKNFVPSQMVQVFREDSIKKISLKNVDTSSVKVFRACFYDNRQIEKVPAFDFSSAENMQNFLYRNISLNNTILDVRSAKNLQIIGCYSTSSQYSMQGFKGLRVSNEAPFDYATPPQINVNYTGLDRNALVQLFNDLPYNVGYTAYNTATISDNIVSFGGPTGYLRLAIFPAASANWEITLKATTTYYSDQNQQRLIAGGAFYVRTKPGSLIWQLYLAGSEVDLGGTVSNYPYLKLIKIDSTISAYMSTDGTNWELKKENISIGNINDAILNLGASNLSWRGTLDLNETHIKVNSVYWFRGQPAITKTLSCVGCTGTADLTAEDKDIALNKGWSLTLS